MEFSRGGITDFLLRFCVVLPYLGGGGPVDYTGLVATVSPCADGVVVTPRELEFNSRRGLDILASFFLLPVDLFAVAVRAAFSPARTDLHVKHVRVQPPPSVATITIRIKKKTRNVLLCSWWRTLNKEVE